MVKNSFLKTYGADMWAISIFHLMKKLSKQQEKELKSRNAEVRGRFIVTDGKMNIFKVTPPRPKEGPYRRKYIDKPSLTGKPKEVLMYTLPKKCFVKKYYRTAAKFLFKMGVRIKPIAALLNVGADSVRRWLTLQMGTKYKRKRHGKYEIIREAITSMAEGKTTGTDGMSSMRITDIVNEELKIMHEKGKYKGPVLNISRSTVLRILKKAFGKPMASRRTFYLNDANKAARLEFCKKVLEGRYKNRNLFFTDEKYFSIFTLPNRSTNLMWVSKESKRLIKMGDATAMEKLMFPEPKFHNKVMVAGGISPVGTSRLIFLRGDMDKFQYLQVLEEYRKDFNRLKVEDNTLMFQQDNAPAHIAIDLLRNLP